MSRPVLARCYGANQSAPASVALLARLYTDAPTWFEKRTVAHAAVEAAAHIGDACDTYWRKQWEAGFSGRDIDDPVGLATLWMQDVVLDAVGFHSETPLSASPRDGDRARYGEEIARLDEIVRAILIRRGLIVAP